MQYLKRTLSAWVLIMMAESYSGAFRRLVLVPRIGELAAHQVGVVAGCAIIFVAAWFFFARTGSAPSRSYLLSGLIWMVLTVLFEIGLGLSMGYTTGRILADYDLPKGGLMGIGLLFMFFAPLMAAQLRRKILPGE